MKIHLENLKNSIRKKNLLELNPIIINDKNEVIDGQHRLAAAQALNTDVYYVKGNGLTLDDVILLNTSSKVWRLDDYLHSYAARGFKAYKMVEPFATKWGISTSNAIAILGSVPGEHFQAPQKAFKLGKFEIADEAVANEFIKRLKEIAVFTVNEAWTDREFMRAMWKLYYNEAELDHETFMRKVQSWPKPITRRQSTREYLRQFEDIYNRDLQKKVRFF
jgi:hypothetical protein